MKTENLAARRAFAVVLLAALCACGGCIKPKITVFPDYGEPLRECTLKGGGTEKILVVPIKGFIADARKDSILNRRPGMVQEVVSHLNKAEKDKGVKALVLKIDSPGGTVTASDVLYHEIVKFRQKSGAKIVAVMMSVAASGGYYVALPADRIVAHPTTITGSVGVVFLRPNVTGLMGKIGIEVETDKSGKNKDMGSPFRKATDEERLIMRGVIDDFAGRFVSLVAARRNLGEDATRAVASARIYTAPEALRLGLVDQIGYLDDAIDKAAEIAGLPKDARVIAYRRTEFPDDNLYNTTAGGRPGAPDISLVDTGLADMIPFSPAGFYYLWLPNLSN